MGLTHVAVNVKNLSSNASFTKNFLVDTGAWHAMAPESELMSIGIDPIGTKTYELANGELHDFQYGFVQISFMQEITVSEIIFGPDRSEPILGVYALESAGFIVDPPNHTIRKLSAFPLKRVA